MAYLEDDGDVFREDDEAVVAVESDGDEGWEPARSGEAIGPVYRRQYRPGGLRIPSRPQLSRPVGSLAGGFINTPAGRAQFRLEKPVATKESVEALTKELKAEMKANVDAIKKVDQTVDKNTSVLDRKIGALEAQVNKAHQHTQQAMLLPLLLSKSPEIEKLKIGDKNVPAFGANVEIPIASGGTTYKKDDNFALLLPLMMMSGGLGGGSADSSNMLILALALTGGLGKR